MQCYERIYKNHKERKILKKPVNTRFCRVIQSYAKYNKNTFHLPRQHLQKPNGRVYIKRHSKKARDF